MIKTKILRLALMTAVLWLAFFTEAIFARAGDLDVSFGGDGIVSTPLPNESIGAASGLLVQADGKLLVSVLAVGQDFDSAIVRYNPDGTLDTTFSGDGVFNSPFPAGDADAANAIAQQADGRLLVAGPLISGKFGGFYVLRLNPDGSLDTTFSGDGIMTGSILGTADARALAVQPDGKILVAGITFNSSSFEDYFAVTRLNSNGSLDTAFGVGGSATVSFGAIDFFDDMALQADGKIILMGNADQSSANPYLAMVRFNANGVLDNTFDGDGRVMTRIEGLHGNSLTTQPDGKILVGGSLFSAFAVVRYNPNGSLDTTFDGDGIATTAFGTTSDGVNDLIVQPDNKIIAAGETAVGPSLLDLDMATARFNADGSLDTNFGTNGKVVVRVSGESDLANAVALQPDGKIVLAGAGTELGSRQVTLVRLRTQNQTKFDYDGDGRADISLFRPSSSVWYIQNSSDNSYGIRQFGSSGDRLAAADFDGDSRTDLAVFRPSEGVWHRLNSSNNTTSAVAFGAASDVPVPADFDGDGRADIAVYRPSNGTWWITRSRDGAVSVQSFGLSEDKPTPGDFDGDGQADIAVFRPSTNVWYRINSSNGQASAYQFGLSGDQPTAADFDGDSRTDIAVFRPSEGVWYRLNSASESFSIVRFGLAEDKPVAADYDGDGRADIAVYRPSDGTWYLLRSTAGFAAARFGLAEDIPTPFSLY